MTPPESATLRAPAARLGKLLEGLRGPRVELALMASPSFLLLLFAVAVFLWFAGDEGGFYPTTWLPATLLLLGVLVVGLVVLPPPRPRRTVLVAVGLLALYAAWSYLSITWAHQKGISWDGANRTVLYAIVFAIFVLWPIRGGPAAVLLGMFGLGVAVIGLVEILRANAASSAIAFLHEGRFSEPVGYDNGNVALWMSGLWPCVVLAGRREVPTLLRGLFLGSAGLLGCLAVLGQSRSWLFAVPIMAVIAIAVVPGRGRTIAALAAVIAGVMAVRGPLLDYYQAFDPSRPPGPAFADAVHSTLLISVILGLVGVAAAMVDRAVRVDAQTARRVSVAVVAAVALGAVVTTTAVVVAAHDPLGTVSDKWKEFKKGQGEPHFNGSRLASASFSSYRADAWRVAWDSFRQHPVRGIGADNFLQEYALHGHSNQTPSYPHSVEFRTLSQTGVVGTLLLGGALVAALMAALPACRGGGGVAGAAGGGAVLGFAYWFVHGSADWFWEFPGLGAPAFAMLGLACALAAGRFPTLGAGLPRRRPVLAAAGVVAAAIVIGLTMPWLAERNLRDAREKARSDPKGALESLDRASRLNPLSAVPHETAGLVQVDRGRSDAAAAEFRKALDRDPRDPFSYLELAAIASSQGRRADALRLIERAHGLAPRDRVVLPVRRALRRGERVPPSRIRNLVLRDIDERIGPD
jgi:O-antigen ligase/polysaccharide polymerase Wzy-like membrane protein